MKKHIPLKIIAVYEMLGGLTGIVLIFFSIFPRLVKQSVHPGIVVLYFFIFVFLCLYLLSTVAGVLLWMNKKIGYLLSFIVQLFQVPYIVTSSLVYIFIAGASAIPYFTREGAGLTFYIGSRFLFQVGRPLSDYEIGINCIALFLAMWVLIAWRKFLRKGNFS